LARGQGATWAYAVAGSFHGQVAAAVNLFGIGPMELVLIVILALIVLGPEKLPEVMAQAGRVVSEFRSLTTQLSEEFNRTIQTELSEPRAAVDETRSTTNDAVETVNDAMTGNAPPRVVSVRQTTPTGKPDPDAAARLDSGPSARISVMHVPAAQPNEIPAAVGGPPLLDELLPPY